MNLVALRVLGLMSLCAVGNVYAHSFPLNQAAMDSCIQKKRSQSCQYTSHHNDVYIGTCQYISDEQLTCVRNKPIQKINSDSLIFDKKIKQKSHESVEGSDGI